MIALALAATLFAPADALTDLRATLARLAGTTPVHGTYDVTTTTHNDEDAQPSQGKASLGFQIDDGGLRILYPKPILAQATQEARSEAIDPERQTPARTGINHIRPLHLAELLDAAAALTVDLQNAQLKETRGPRVLVFKLTPKLTKSTSKHLKKLDLTLTLTLGDDGIPLAGEQVMSAKASFLLMSFQTDETQKWTFARSGDRLVATRYEENRKSDGMGQHQKEQTVEVIRLEP